ncbi:dTDP-4-dehydrorhamnose 3,5-epimerase [Gelidibacter salicanalis]|uniref:dTDP-4-dehydrorhamnose 3,5-epimerase n=1 Tax=Gelidibacter salicanalis TaxID=291193 RepID=A0A934NHQ8_9FLAO|nr:dTDP-4-dehydrorhamnose 3,5-epimerase [Gelidibacter salicanalis]MBJ7879179.1 dTDP-4-dehydrorhamnose 3,5-epimerase [Gelidibacter salicanalis]
MKKIETDIEGCFILEPTLFNDERGYFFESFNEDHFHSLTNTEIHFVQDNQSFSKFGVLRGLHAQSGTHAQAKLVRVLQGEVLDVAVDARKGSSTFGQHVAVRLSAENQRQFFVPRGFLHGFVVLSETAEFFYKCDNYYNKESEGGISYDDETLNIDWLLNKDQLCVSEKDLILPKFNDVFQK